MKLLVLWPLALVAAAATATNALNVDVSDVYANTDAGSDPQQSVARTWTVSNDQPLTSLGLQVPGRVFLESSKSSDPESTLAGSQDQQAQLTPVDQALPSTAGESVVAMIVVTSNSSELLDLLEVVPEKDDQHPLAGVMFRVQQNSSDNKRRDVYGFLLAQISLVHPKALQSITAAGSGDVVVQENVLMDSNLNESVVLTSAGSGDIFWSSSDPISLASLAATVAGSGQIQVETPSFTASEGLLITVAGSGDIALVADSVTTGDLVSTVAGSGDLFVQTAELQAKTLTATVGGSGDVTIGASGSCGNQTVNLAGSGDVNTGSIVSENAVVRLMGSGHVVVHVKHELSTSTLFSSGTVKYVGDRPDEIKSTSGLIFRKHSKNQVKPAVSNKVKTYKPSTLPSRKPKLVKLELSKSSWYVSMNALDASTGGMVTSFSSTFSHHVRSSTIWLVGILCVAAAFVAVYKVRQQRRHAAYSILG